MRNTTLERPDPVDTMIAQDRRAEIAVACGRVANTTRWAEAVLMGQALRRINTEEARG